MTGKTFTSIFTSKAQEDIIVPLASGRKRRRGSLKAIMVSIHRRLRNEWTESEKEIGIGSVQQEMRLKAIEEKKVWECDVSIGKRKMHIFFIIKNSNRVKHGKHAPTIFLPSNF